MSSLCLENKLFLLKIFKNKKKFKKGIIIEKIRNNS
tara:strand:+ start:1700 stop:1807 length:108 start_codon:yes stop_codon:yes gene_type:complete